MFTSDLPVVLPTHADGIWLPVPVLGAINLTRSKQLVIIVTAKVHNISWQVLVLGTMDFDIFKESPYRTLDLCSGKKLKVEGCNWFKEI